MCRPMRCPLLPLLAGGLVLALLATPSARCDPGSATSSLTTRIHVDLREAAGRRVEGKVRGHALAVDQPKEFGADDSAPTPPETLAFALGACVVSTARYLALLDSLDIRDLRATVDGTLDYSRASGLPTQERAGFQSLQVRLDWAGGMDADQRRDFLEKLRQRCPMCDNLEAATPVSLSSANLRP